MEQKIEVEPFRVFSESLIWQLNRDYYQNVGMSAWTSGVVPHQVSSSSLVGRTYAELILAVLKDLAAKGSLTETVYIVELGAGHGRLGFHILKHLEKLLAPLDISLPPYCYILTDIVEDNLAFYKAHPQFHPFYQSGVLDYAYYDAMEGTSLELRYAKRTINPAEIAQPLIALGNYFFDSIPNDLFRIEQGSLSLCSLALHSTTAPDTALQLKDLSFSYRHRLLSEPYYESEILDGILSDYQSTLTDSYLFFPEKGIACLSRLKALSNSGLVLLSLDKGYHKLAKLDHRKEPEIVTHGSFSLWVNFHALGAFCERSGGRALFPADSANSIEVACLMFLDDAASFHHAISAYQHFVNDFGPDDFNIIKKLSYDNIERCSLMHLLALLRLSAYDSSFFVAILPRIKKLIKRLSKLDRERLAPALDFVWNFYFNINEKQDLSLEIAGIFFDLGFYEKALQYFNRSTDSYGAEADTYYNKILCYYQLRRDVQFSESLAAAKLLFPDSDLFDKLDLLDLEAV